MSRDASLDEFLGDDGAADGAAGADGGAPDADPEPPASASDPEPDAPTDGATDGPGDADESSTDAPEESAEPAGGGGTGASEDPAWPSLDADAVAPARSTYAWSPAGADCAACGATVERRWRDETGLVCADCKTW